MLLIPLLLKALLLTETTEDGIMTSFKLSQLLNAPDSIFVMLSGMSIVSSFVQPANVYESIELIFLGILIVSRFLQIPNAYEPSDVISLGIDSVVNA